MINIELSSRNSDLNLLSQRMTRTLCNTALKKHNNIVKEELLQKLLLETQLEYFMTISILLKENE